MIEDKGKKASFWKIMQISILRFGFFIGGIYFFMMVFLNFEQILDGYFPFWEILFDSLSITGCGGILFGLIMWLVIKFKREKKR